MSLKDRILQRKTEWNLFDFSATEAFIENLILFTRMYFNSKSSDLARFYILHRKRENVPREASAFSGIPSFRNSLILGKVQ